MKLLGNQWTMGPKRRFEDKLKRQRFVLSPVPYDSLPSQVDPNPLQVGSFRRNDV